MFCTSMTALQDGNELAVEVLVQLFFWLVFGFIAAAVAAGRGRSVVGWFFSARCSRALALCCCSACLT